MDRMSLPRDHKVTVVGLVALMAIATLLVFLLLSLTRSHLAH
jgi:hypothetical protein